MNNADYNRAYRAEEYKWLKSHHVCTQCRRERAAPRRNMCLVCLHDMAENKRQYRKNNREKVAEASRKCKKRLYDERKSAGVCVSCGKRPQKDGRVRCGLCLSRQRRNAETMRRKRGQWAHDMLLDPGVCYNCKGAALPNMKLCGECREKSIVNLKKATAAIQWDKHPWR